MFACLAGVALITLVVSNLGSLEGTSETSAAAGSSTTGAPYAGRARIISSGSGAASVAGTHDGPAVATSFVGPKQTTNAQCTTDDCWVIRSKSTPDCRVATIVMEFEVTDTGKPDRHETITVPLREGVGDVAVEAHTGSASQAENYSDVADAWCSTS